MIGQSINHYQITAKLGEGGMGAVYRATDTQLSREVALKILPERFVRDRQMLGRFQREAELLASLNHPHISIIHGLEESGELRALVLELVEGPTLAERIGRGPIPADEALQIALEIAQALEAAHEKGIIHRDLKPANIKITPEGSVKVLDFGLAKALETGPDEGAADSETVMPDATQQGTILGTAAYMSPEQARGQPLDKRTDIFSFGLVLFEMLSGTGMYSGRSLPETLAAVIHEDPKLDELPPETPEPIRKLIERCLRKDTSIRWRDIGDVRIALAECLSGTTQVSELSAATFADRPLWRQLGSWAAVPVLMAVAWVLRSLFHPIPHVAISRWEMPLDGQVLAHQFRTGLSLSPDGSRLAFVSTRAKDQQSIYLRSLDRWEAERLSDDINLMPFFSPDGRWLGAVARAEDGSGLKLKKYSVNAGTASTICDCKEPYGATWVWDDSIIFTCEIGGPLWRVSALGGEPEQLTELDPEAGEVSHRLPHSIPGTKAVLFTVLLDNYADPKSSDGVIAVRSLESGEQKALINGGWDARYVSSGHLVFARDGTLWAAPFDPAGLAVTGPEFPVLEGVSHALNVGNGRDSNGSAQFAVSNTGSLAYIEGSVYPDSGREVIWVDHGGNAESIGVESARYSTVRLSPDGARVALAKSGQIWTYDLVRHALEIQIHQGSRPIWSTDGSSLVFESHRDGVRSLFSSAVDGIGVAKQLSPSSEPQFGGSWHPDGTRFAFTQTKPDTFNDSDIWILSMDGSHSAQPFLETSFLEASPEFSPDGRWLAYTSNETGQLEIYVQRYPEGAKQRISTDGGLTPSWSGSGNQLFYLTFQGSSWATKKYWVVDIRMRGDTLTPGIPVSLFEKDCVAGFPHRSYDVASYNRLLMVSRDGPGEERMLRDYLGRKVNIVLNWSEEVRRRAPSD